MSDNIEESVALKIVIDLVPEGATITVMVEPTPTVYTVSRFTLNFLLTILNAVLGCSNLVMGRPCRLKVDFGNEANKEGK